MSTASNPFSIPTLTFCLSSLKNTASKFSPRLGQLTVTRTPPDASRDVVEIKIPTPGLICSTTRGVVQHLSGDNVRRTECVKWVHFPFESFLQANPPVPTLQGGSHPLHTFLGFPPSSYIVSVSLRDPADGRETPANGKQFVTAQSSRGSRKVECPAYRSYISAILPDIVFPLSDVPFTPSPHSQKRISKSIERSTQWLASMLAPLDLPIASGLTSGQNSSAGTVPREAQVSRFNIFLHMVGDITPTARAAFAAALQEPLEQKEKELLAPFKTLDEGVSGYVFDLVPLRTALLARAVATPTVDAASPPASSNQRGMLTYSLVPLIKASLADLPVTKPRLANTADSPHEMLSLIRDAGMDLFDTFWAQQAASWGVALDFRFPVPRGHRARREKQQEKCDIGHNLYDTRYAHDFGTLADSFVGERQSSKRPLTPLATGEPLEALEACSCGACSPTWEDMPIVHSGMDERGTAMEEGAPPYTRAYVHHLLHTHEMSAHALLVMHNLAVMEAFMHGVRKVLRRDTNSRSAEGASRDGAGYDGKGRATIFAAEVELFERTYDAELRVLDAAKLCWAEVDRARGKGRLARERAKRAVEELSLEDVVVGGQSVSEG